MLTHREANGYKVIHLEFAVAFGYAGSEKRSVTVGKIVHSNYPSHFDAWKLAGIPGMSPYLSKKMLTNFRPL